MNNPTPNEAYRDDEIDLRKLFQAIGNGFANIGKAFINLIIRIRRVTIKYKLLFLVAIIAAAILGVTYNKVAKPYYSTSMLLSSEYFNAKLVENSIGKINALCEEDERNGLAKVLGIDLSIAKNIKGFDFEPLVSEQDIVDVEVLKNKLEELKVKDPDIAKVIDQIQIENKNTFIITVHVYNTDIIGNLQESLVNYFKNNPYIKNRIDINRKNQKVLVEKLEKDIAQLDSLKNLYNLNLKASAGRKDMPGSSSVYVGESGVLDPTSFYTQSVSLYWQLQKAQEELELGEDFEVVDGFTVFSKPESPNILKAVVFSVLIFIGLTYLLIMAIEANVYLNKIERERFTKN